MSANDQLRAAAFGTLDGSLWAAVLDRGQPSLVVGTAGGSSAAEGIARGLHIDVADDGAWQLSGDGVALTIAPAAAPEPPDDAPLPEPPAEGPADQQLCRVTGTITLGGGARTVDCVGTRLTTAGKAVAKAASARGAAAWFADDEALEIVAVRPARSGHEGDAVAATLFDPDRWIAISDPRLSTTYDEAGAPLRANLELWISVGEREFTRRAAGEVSGPAVIADGNGTRLSVTPLRCHSRGHDGFGIYALAALGDG